MSITRLGCSSRNTPTVRISGGNRRVMSYTCCAAIWRVDGANTKPTASAPIATANRASSSVVIPQIFTNMRTRGYLPDLADAAEFVNGDRGVGRRDQRFADEHGVIA